MGAELPHPPGLLPAAAVKPRPRRLAGLEWTLLLLALALLGAAPAPGVALSVGAGLLLAASAVRWLRTGHFTRPTALDWPLALFALSGLAGLWAAPNLAAALPHLYLFFAALALYYALANSRGRVLWLAALGLVVLTGVLAMVFVIEPHSAGRAINDIDGLLGPAAPVALALLVDATRTWKTTRAPPAARIGVVSGLALLAMVPALVLAQSRTLWLALAATLGLAAWWWAAGRVVRRRHAPTRHLAVFWAGVGTAVLAGLWVTWWWLATAANSPPGAPMVDISRFVLWGQAWQLAQAAPFTGGGLGAFPALYSTYIHAIPFYLLAHAHNSYLNLLVEQGWTGLAAYGMVLASSAWVATRALARPSGPNRTLLVGGAAGLAVVAFQGLGDATLVATRFIPFLLVPAGLVVAAGPASQAQRRPAAWPWALAAGLILLAGLWVYRPAQAAWRANLGVVLTNRVLLARWPTGQFSEGRAKGALAGAVRHFEAALRLQPDQFTAHYYLGLQRLAERDFEAAGEHLAQAYAVTPTHRGVVKTLGYTYVWAGRFADARPLLQQIPEARHELEVYAWWWAERQRADLSANATHMLALLP